MTIATERRQSASSPLRPTKSRLTRTLIGRPLTSCNRYFRRFARFSNASLVQYKPCYTVMRLPR